MCIAVGKVSFELWDLLQSSFGCNSFSPAISFPRFAMTSFTFMLDWVPLPVCQTASGKLPCNLPARISSQTVEISFSFFSSKTPRRKFARAAASFR